LHVIVSGSQPVCDPLGQVVDRTVRDWVIELPVEDLRLPSIWHSLMESAEGGLGQHVRPKPPGLGAVRLHVEDLVSAREVVFPVFVLGYGEWHRERGFNNRLRDVIVWIGEDTVTIRAIAVFEPDGFVWVRRRSSYAFVTRIASR